MAEEEIKTTATETTDTPVSQEMPDSPATTAPSKKKKLKKTVAYGQMHVQATFNNTIVSFTDQAGGVLSTSSAGACGFRGSKKGTAYAAQVAAEKAANVAKTQYGLSKVDIFVKGIGQGRDMAMRAILNMDIAIESIKDVTGVPHGGVRPRKARRN
jgi:small subunit ribosomal protein S11